MDIKLGRYRHFKGHEYLVIGVAKHSETLEELVVYKPLNENANWTLWVRPIKMFMDTVEFEGKEIHRFKFIEENEK